MEQGADIDELGPIDWIVVEFPGSRFNGEIAPELVALQDSGIIRILDLVIVKKDDDGEYEVFELADLEAEEIGDLGVAEGELAMLLSKDDVDAIAAAIEPGSSAGILVWENTWAGPFGAAVRRSGGQLVANGRIPTQALLAAVEAEVEAAEAEGVQ
jgi:hypothetical protein